MKGIENCYSENRNQGLDDAQIAVRNILVSVQGKGATSLS